MAGLHRLLPESEGGKFRLFADPGAWRWAAKGWAPSVYLSVFQPVFFVLPGFQRIVLRAFEARLGAGTLVTSRTVIREPHRIRIGRSALIGEFSHLACSYQPRLRLLVVADIEIGDEVLVGAYSHLAPGVRIGSGTVLEHGVHVAAHTSIGARCRVGEGTTLYNRVRIGDDVRIGKRCLIASGVEIADGARIPDGTVLAAPGERLPLVPA
jgi:UDP-3-O-[3-hydroxymyristoyl] glucosamine N-acyltransferase